MYVVTLKKNGTWRINPPPGFASGPDSLPVVFPPTLQHHPPSLFSPRDRWVLTVLLFFVLFLFLFSLLVPRSSHPPSLRFESPARLTRSGHTVIARIRQSLRKRICLTHVIDNNNRLLLVLARQITHTFQTRNLRVHGHPSRYINHSYSPAD